MLEEKVKIDVQFRMLKGEVIAVFPYQIEGMDEVGSYMHIGQHSACSWNINTFSKPATPNQYRALKSELEGNGYIVNVIKRRNHVKYLKTYYREKEKRYNEQFIGGWQPDFSFCEIRKL